MKECSYAANVALEAAGIVDGARQQTHGPRERSFAMAAALWSIWLGIEITPADVAECLSLLKKARRKCGLPIRDHYVDDVGYVALAAELALGAKEKAP